ncbi:MAG: septal ring lytic transglycosylase RlpA family protein [Chlorobiales bacterium]|nr:septal ring lytic transglycosylase RlpA family protein [Chlorobiales bacterium]
MRNKKHIVSLSFFTLLIVIGASLNINGINLSEIAGNYNPLYNSAEATQRTNLNKTLTSSKQSRALSIVAEGKASYYADQFHGRRTANGETFNMHKLTAAHPSLPFGTWVKVTNLHNGKDVVVRINDRGPYVKGRIIDLSIDAAKEIGIMRSGTVRVKLEALKSNPSA